MSNQRLIAAAALVVAGLASSALASVPNIVLDAQADAEFREDAPETARGAAATNTELAVRITSGQNRGFIVRFDLTGVTVADILAAPIVDLRFYSRNANLGGTNAGGIKIYGLNPANPLASTWDETTVHYRDAGEAVPTVAGNHPISQPSPGTVGVGQPPPNPPVYVTNPGTWGSDPNDPTRVPGLRHENPPYSAAAEATNTTRYTNNLNKYNADVADGVQDGLIGAAAYTYETYVNQPGYTQQTVTGTYPDLASYDRPLYTVDHPRKYEDGVTDAPGDVDPTQTTFLGYLNYDAKSPARPAGTMFSFTTLVDSPVTMASEVAANRAGLVGYLVDVINGGYTHANFLVFQKSQFTGDPYNDPLPIRSDNLIFASKEFQPTGGNIGDWAPELVLIPEPASLSVLALAAAGMLRRRR